MVHEEDNVITEQQRDGIVKDWRELREACRKQHPRGPGGAAMCYCGAGCGGSAACAMLKVLSLFLSELDPEVVPAHYREWLSALQKVL